MEATYVVSHAEYGLLVARGSAPPPSVLTEMRFVEVPTLPVDKVSFSRLLVSSGGQSTSHLVLLCHEPFLSSETCEAIRKALKGPYDGVLVSCTRSSEEGSTDVVTDGPFGEAAAAAAEDLRAGAWDESESFRVVVNGTPFSVELRLDLPPWGSPHKVRINAVVKELAS